MAAPVLPEPRPALPIPGGVAVTAAAAGGAAERDRQRAEPAGRHRQRPTRKRCRQRHRRAAADRPGDRGGGAAEATRRAARRRRQRPRQRRCAAPIPLLPSAASGNRQRPADGIESQDRPLPVRAAAGCTARTRAGCLSALHNQSVTGRKLAEMKLAASLICSQPYYEDAIEFLREQRKELRNWPLLPPTFRSICDDLQRNSMQRPPISSAAEAFRPI